MKYNEILMKIINKCNKKDKSLLKYTKRRRTDDIFNTYSGEV